MPLASRSSHEDEAARGCHHRRELEANQRDSHAPGIQAVPSLSLRFPTSLDLPACSQSHILHKHTHVSCNVYLDKLCWMTGLHGGSGRGGLIEFEGATSLSHHCAILTISSTPNVCYIASYENFGVCDYPNTVSLSNLGISAFIMMDPYNVRFLVGAAKTAYNNSVHALIINFYLTIMWFTHVAIPSHLMRMEWYQVLNLFSLLYFSLFPFC